MTWRSASSITRGVRGELLGASDTFRVEDPPLAGVEAYPPPVVYTAMGAASVDEHLCIQPNVERSLPSPHGVAAESLVAIALGMVLR